MNTTSIRSGFILILTALASGFFVPAMAIPRLGLSAHTVGIISGILLIAIGAVWSQFSLSDRQQKVMLWSWIYAGYANWLGNMIGGLLGAGKTTPLAAGGAIGSPVAEGLVAALLVSVGLVSLIAVCLSIWGLRSKAPAG